MKWGFYLDFIKGNVSFLTDIGQPEVDPLIRFWKKLNYQFKKKIKKAISLKLNEIQAYFLVQLKYNVIGINKKFQLNEKKKYLIFIKNS